MFFTSSKYYPFMVFFYPESSLQNFSYTNNNMSRLFFSKMSETNFEGISVSVYDKA